MAYAVLDLLVEAIAAVTGVDLGAANPQARAYRKAWRRRTKVNDLSAGVLEDVLRERRIPGAFGPHDAPEVVLMYRAWEAGMPPGDARKAFGRNFDQAGAP